MLSLAFPFLCVLVVFNKVKHVYSALQKVFCFFLLLNVRQRKAVVGCFRILLPEFFYWTKAFRLIVNTKTTPC